MQLWRVCVVLLAIWWFANWLCFICMHSFHVFIHHPLCIFAHVYTSNWSIIQLNWLSMNSSSSEVQCQFSKVIAFQVKTLKLKGFFICSRFLFSAWQEIQMKYLFNMNVFRSNKTTVICYTLKKRSDFIEHHQPGHERTRHRNQSGLERARKQKKVGSRTQNHNGISDVMV